MTRKIKYSLTIISQARPQHVVMPIIMILFAASGLIIALFAQELIARVYYCFVALLFVFIPATTVMFVIKHPLFSLSKKRHFLLRMFITSCGTFAMGVMYVTPFWRYILIIFCGIGTIFFIIDYVKQADLSIKIFRYARTVLLKNNNLEEALKTKCSRSVVYECMKRHPCSKTRFRILLVIKKLGLKWYHLFPLTDRSLIEVIYISFKKL